jgi:hypothetical protein
MQKAMSGYLYLHLQSLLKKPRLASKCPVPALRIKKSREIEMKGKLPYHAFSMNNNKRKRWGNIPKVKRRQKRVSCHHAPSVQHSIKPDLQPEEKEQEKVEKLQDLLLRVSPNPSASS